MCSDSTNLHFYVITFRVEGILDFDLWLVALFLSFFLRLHGPFSLA
jgi:hypothetical protein